VRGLLLALGWPARARVGVLALQGGFAAHARALAAAGHEVSLVRDAAALVPLDALVLPGGESTAQLKLIARGGLEGPLDEYVASGRFLFATCAGLILAARRVLGPEQPSFGWLDVTVQRNAWGRQQDSFEAVADDGCSRIVAIRAPRLLALGPQVKTLVSLRGEPLLVRQGPVAGAVYHPELVDDEAVAA
jgi:5'-phosphate synthase pdxT subunit